MTDTNNLEINSEIIDIFIKKIKNDTIKQFVKNNKKHIEQEPIKVEQKHKDVFYSEFGLLKKGEARIKTPIGTVKVQRNHYVKLRDHNDKHRKNFIRHIRPTLERPNEIIDNNGEQFYLKLFCEKAVRLHVTIVKIKHDGVFYVTNIPMNRIKKWEEIKKKGSPIYELPQVCK